MCVRFYKLEFDKNAKINIFERYAERCRSFQKIFITYNEPQFVQFNITTLMKYKINKFCFLAQTDKSTYLERRTAVCGRAAAVHDDF